MSLPLAQQLRRRKPIVFQHRHHKGEELARNLTTFQLMMFGVGATVGTGVFFVLGEAVPKAGPAVLVSFVIAGIAAGLSALCYAELASAIPVSGSTYSYAYHALGELVAVVIAGCVLLEYGVATGAVAVGWSGYFNELIHALFGFKLPQALSVSPIPGTDGVATGGIINLPAVVLVLLCMFLLLRGATESAKVNAAMVLIKIAVLGLFSVIGFSAFNADHFSNFFAAGAAGISAAAGTIFFSFIGLDAVATAGEEVKDPQKALPRAIIGALLIVSGAYIAVAAAGLAAKPASFFSSPEAADAGLAQILKDNALAAISAHASWEGLTQEIQKEIDKYQELGCHHLVISALPPEFRSKEGFHQFAKVASGIGQKLAEAGMTLAYHNHSFEFVKYGDQTGLEIIRAAGDPKFLGFELDTYWVQDGGADPAEWIRKLAGRVPMVHMKDVAVIPVEKEFHPKRMFAEVGEGNLNWPAILTAAREIGVEWCFVEQDDCYGRDPFESLAISYRNLVAMGLS